MHGRTIVVALIASASITCSANAPIPSSPPVSSSAIVPDEESALAKAVAMKRAGDPVSAWKLVETIPASSSARFDPRYSEVMGAWADARASELGTEIAGSRGGGPPASTSSTSEAEGPARALRADKIEGIVASKRSRLRAACFSDSTKTTSFVLKLHIDTDGRVLDATTSDIKGDALVASCVRSHAAAWTFPKNLEGAEHRTKFMFAR